MNHRSPVEQHPLIRRIIWFLLMMHLTSCARATLSTTPISPTIENTASPTFILPSPTQLTSTPNPTQTVTAGPSPTSTPLPPLSSHTWQAQPIMIEAARIEPDPADPFQYTPFFILYGDGTLVIRSCEDGECRYEQVLLGEEALCQLINAVERTGFFYVSPTAFSLPSSTGAEIHLSVQVDIQNSAQIPDLDRWVNTPNWYADQAGCQNCFIAPRIDRAFIDLYRLLTTYQNPSLSGLKTERLAVWITDPVIAGSALSWDEGLVPLSSLVEKSSCPEGSEKQQAVVIEGREALAIAEFLSNQPSAAPIFTDGDITQQVHSRWLLPYEMPQSCGQPAGLFPPDEYETILWQCSPEMGAIPTSTPTITPTPTITRTPLR